MTLSDVMKLLLNGKINKYYQLVSLFKKSRHRADMPVKRV